MASKTAFDLWCEVNDAEIALNRPGRTWEEWKSTVRWERSGQQVNAEEGYGELYRGATTLEGYSLNEPSGFTAVTSWEDYPYRQVWASRAERVILTYCEGDLNYEQAADDTAFSRMFKRHAAFYQQVKR